MFKEENKSIFLPKTIHPGFCYEPKPQLSTCLPRSGKFMDSRFPSEFISRKAYMTAWCEIYDVITCRTYHVYFMKHAVFILITWLVEGANNIIESFGKVREELSLQIKT